MAFELCVFRKQTVEKTRSYKKGLKDINSKLADRPFLFEQVAQVRSKFCYLTLSVYCVLFSIQPGNLSKLNLSVVRQMQESEWRRNTKTR